jgi:hypothetical protein
MFAGSPRLIRATPSIFGGNEMDLPISASIRIFGVSIVILGFGDAACRGHATVSRGFGFLPVVAASPGRWGRRIPAWYPAHFLLAILVTAAPRRPVPAGLERNEA